MKPIRIRRAYDAPEPEDGYRVFIDRLWPRGVARNRLEYDLWLKDIAPSPELRRWFGHDPRRWEEFRRRYGAELADKSETVRELLARVTKQPLTLVYAARDRQHNHALVLKEYLEQQRGNPDAAPGD
ncbi:DUF488 domain-containing protein [Geoalkalibacter sp.]|uniref:DUF488 domain-containing protein n=1 Tax=Geoalkalibacter sp. TaxID=3041440 RepID=UPI00272E2056|nr:DUF488 domain-containing protein [Geoalkalibacter sp.]